MKSRYFLRYEEKYLYFPLTFFDTKVIIKIDSSIRRIEVK